MCEGVDGMQFLGIVNGDEGEEERGDVVTVEPMLVGIERRASWYGVYVCLYTCLCVCV